MWWTHSIVLYCSSPRGYNNNNNCLSMIVTVMPHIMRHPPCRIALSLAVSTVFPGRFGFPTCCALKHFCKVESVAMATVPNHSRAFEVSKIISTRKCFVFLLLFRANDCTVHIKLLLWLACISPGSLLVVNGVKIKKDMFLNRAFISIVRCTVYWTCVYPHQQRRAHGVPLGPIKCGLAAALS